jgi:TatD DNase family protein
MTTELIDIGANLAHDSFDDDRDAVLQRAAGAGISRIVVTGSSFDSNKGAVDLAARHPGSLFATAGVHPHHASEYDDAVDGQIREFARDGKIVAVGECGLDYFRNFSPREAQLAAFRSQLEIAAETGLPVFLHQRDAHDDFVEVLEPMLPRLSRAVAHCFTGEHESLREYLALGLYIGVTGWICDERRGMHLREIVSVVPDDRLMIETDAPYLTPRTLQPKPKTRRNEPMHLVEVLRIVAEARDQSALCEPSQNGLLADSPQRHSAALFPRQASRPLLLRIAKLPLNISGPSLTGWTDNGPPDSASSEPVSPTAP